MDNISKSLFSLAKYNAGFFKSNKQAKFLLDQVDGIHICTQTHIFGDHGGAKRTVTYYFHVNESGVTKIEKMSSTGVKKIYFERDEESIAKSEEHRAALEHNKIVQAELDEVIKKRDHWSARRDFMWNNKQKMKETIMSAILHLDPFNDEDIKEMKRVCNKMEQIDAIDKKIDDMTVYYIRKIDEVADQLRRV